MGLDQARVDKAFQRRPTASEFGTRMLSGNGFGSSLVRQILAAVHKTAGSEETAAGLNWLKSEMTDYWGAREKILHILEFLGKLDQPRDMDHWHADASAARLLAGAARNDHV